MSALTKLFTVLLVVCSLLLTAATVVFINRVEDYRKEAAAQKSAKEQAVRDSGTATEQLEALRAEVVQLTAANNAHVSLLNQAVQERDLRNSALETQIIEQKNQLSNQNSQVQNLTDTVKISHDTLVARDEEIKTLRSDNAKLTSQYTDMNALATRLQKDKDQLIHDSRFYTEQIADLKKLNEKQAVIIKEANLSTDTPARIASAPAINGVIRNVKSLNNMLYATISVGAADRVEKGMQFKVISGTGDFMGVLTVDSVEANEAFGKLDGPRVQDVRENMPVRTQL